MDQNPGLQFLAELICRAEKLLIDMSLMLRNQDVPLSDVVNMINSIHQSVNTWEDIVQKLMATRRSDDSEGGGLVQMKTAEKKELLLVEFSEDEDNEVVEEEKVEEEEQPKPAWPVFDASEPDLGRFQPGQQGRAIIGCICAGDDEFYMSDLSARMLSEVMNTLQNMEVALDELPESTRAVFGVRFEGVIMRTVRNRAANGGKRYVKLLDTGEVLPYDPAMELYELPPFYAKQPPFAFRCKLESANGREVANKRAFLLTNLYATKTYRVLKVEPTHLVVDLSDDLPVKASESKQLLAIEEKPKNYKVTMDSFTPNQLEELYEEPLNTTNVMKAVMGYVPQDDKRICPFYDPAIEGCFKGAHCKLEHVAKLADGWTRDRSLHKLQIRATLESPRVGDELQLIPTCVVHVDEFYAHVADPVAAAALVDLQDKLNDPRFTEDFRLLNHEPHFHELVFARYSADDRWYRAEVLEFYASDRVSVFYVDFGNREVVDMSRLRYWDDRFDYLPFQAVHCRVANIARIRIAHTDAIAQLSRAIVDQSITARVVDNMSPWEVLISDEEGNDIGSFMVITRLAVAREPLVMSKQQGNMIPG